MQGFWSSMRTDAGLAALPEVSAMIAAVTGSNWDPGQLTSDQQAVVSAAMQRLADVRTAASVADEGAGYGGMDVSISKTRSGGIRINSQSSALGPSYDSAYQHHHEVMNEDVIRESEDDINVELLSDDDQFGVSEHTVGAEQLTLSQTRRLVVGISMFGAGPTLAGWSFLRDFTLNIASDRGSWSRLMFSTEAESKFVPPRTLTIATIVKCTRAIILMALATITDVGERTAFEAQVRRVA